MRLHGFVDQLRRHHDVHIVTFGDVDMDGVSATVVPRPAPPGPVARYRDRIGTVLGAQPSLVRRVEAGGLLAAAKHVARTRPFDVAHLAGSAVGLYGRHLSGLPHVVDIVDAWYLQFEDRILGPLRASTVAHFEADVIDANPITLVAGEADRTALLALRPRARVEVVPNGVDTEYFAPDPHIAPVPGVIAFHGAMDYAPNVDAAVILARSILPAVRAEVPNATLRLVGRNPLPVVQDLAGPAVVVTGEVPDVRAPLLEAEVVACPLMSGTGIKNKVLEAAALGRPLVLTSSALGDIDLGAGAIVAEGADAIAAAIVDLLRSPERRADVGAAARRAVVERWGWARACEMLEAVYADAIAGARR